MKYTAKITNIGESKYIIIPASIRNILKIQDSDLVEVDIKKINNENIVKSYKCRVCSHLFDSDDDIPYCTACGSTAVYEEKETYN